MNGEAGHLHLHSQQPGQSGVQFKVLVIPSIYKVMKP